MIFSIINKIIQKQIKKGILRVIYTLGFGEGRTRKFVGVKIIFGLKVRKIHEYIEIFAIPWEIK